METDKYIKIANGKPVDTETSDAKPKKLKINQIFKMKKKKNNKNKK